VTSGQLVHEPSDAPLDLRAEASAGVDALRLDAEHQQPRREAFEGTAELHCLGETERMCRATNQLRGQLRRERVHPVDRSGLHPRVDGVYHDRRGGAGPLFEQVQRLALVLDDADRARGPLP
jgi:hypothetical protein